MWPRMIVRLPVINHTTLGQHDDDTASCEEKGTYLTRFSLCCQHIDFMCQSVYPLDESIHFGLGRKG